MADEVGRNEDATKILTDRIDSSLRETHTALPGRVVSYDATKQRATVQIQLKREFETSDGTRKELLIPQSLDVPVLLPRAGGYSITFPVAVNDPCLVLFLERDIHGWLANGQAAVPPTARMHDYSDAVAILGLWPNPNPISPTPHTTAIAVRNDAGTRKLEIGTAGVLMDSNLQANVIAGTSASMEAGTDLDLAAGDDIGVDAGGDLALSAAVNVTITAGALLTLLSTGALVLQPTGALTVVSTGAITITRGANELMQILSDALDEIGTSTAGGDPLSNASNIAALKAQIDAMRT